MLAATAVLAPLVVVAGPAPQAGAAEPAFPTVDFLTARADQYLEQRARTVTVTVHELPQHRRLRPRPR